MAVTTVRCTPPSCRSRWAGHVQISLRLDVGSNQVTVTAMEFTATEARFLAAATNAVQVVAGQENPTRFVLLPFPSTVELSAPPTKTEGTYTITLVAKDAAGTVINGPIFGNIFFTLTNRTDMSDPNKAPSTAGFTLNMTPDTGIKDTTTPVTVTYDGQSINANSPTAYTELCALASLRAILRGCVTLSGNTAT